ncbi:putative PPE family protein PPE29 [Mycobacterium montefiorense]|nr:putative PPE family protein PPE29 [Mycobacterium montefiorense]
MLPPEVNSGRMYAGPGAGPMLAAAAGWDGLAAQLHSTAASYESTVSNLTSAWLGPSSAMMAAAITPYMAWMTAAAAQSEQTANQARAAAAAYEAAFVATVPPPVIAANRAQLTALIATNVFGQNTPAIMATNAQYTEMWAQDAAAMYGYAGSSATAAQVTPFSQPPRTTNPAGTADQAAALAQATGTAPANAQSTLAQAMSATPQALQSLTAPAAAADPSLAGLDSFITGPLGPASLFGIGGSPYLLGVENYLLPQNVANVDSASQRLSKIQRAAVVALPESELGSGPRVAGSPGGPGLSAGMGRAGFVGSLAVPQSWTAAAPAVRSLAAVLPETTLGAAPAALAANGQGSLFSNLGLSGLTGRAMAGTGGAAARSFSVGGGAGLGRAATTATIIVIPADEAEE